MKEPFEYLYALIDVHGGCWVIRDDDTEKVAGLPSLLADGWRPLRETSFQVEPYMLVVLERDSRAPEDFGFPRA